MPDTSAPEYGRLGSVWRWSLAGFISLVAWGFTGVAMADANIDDEPIIAWFFVGDLALGLVSVLLIRVRHRWPLGVSVVTNLFACVSTSAAGPATWAVGSVAARHRWRDVAVVAPSWSSPASSRSASTRGKTSLPVWAAILFGALIAGIVIAVGYAMGAQRDLMASLRERAVTAEREQQARVAQAQAAERTRIAREMHDVLAHRISLVAMHAGALSLSHRPRARGAGHGGKDHRGERPPGAARPARRPRRPARPHPPRRRGTRAPAAGARRHRRAGRRGARRRDAGEPRRVLRG